MESWPEIRTTPLDAARRQLNAAIRMLFAKDDALAVHTLAFASYKLLADISLAEGRSDTLNALMEDAGRGKAKEFWNGLNKLANELKHGDRAPDAMIRGVPEEFNEVLLLTGCFFLRELDGLASPESQALWLWFHTLYFINIDDTPPEFDEWLEECHTQLHSERRRDKIRIGSRLLDALHKSSGGKYRMEPDQLLLPWRFVIQPH